MRLCMIKQDGRTGIARLGSDGKLRAYFEDQPSYPGSIQDLIEGGDAAMDRAGAVLAHGDVVDEKAITFLPPLARPPKIICVGLNYADHTTETGSQQPDYPTLFGRFNSSLIGHGAPIVRPRVSTALDYEGEFVAVIGRGGKDIPKERALEHVVGYSVFNDASIRDYQMRTPQWTVGKNFDGTGAFGPYFVTADELPPGAKGLAIQTRLNGEVVQSASTDDMLFDVSTLVSLLSEVYTWEAGDVIVTGTPAGIGLVRKPPLWMKDGDVCEVEVERIGLLRNPVADGA